MKEVRYVCKICGKPFSYSKKSLDLRAEDNESQPERCEECRKLHGQEISGVVTPFTQGRFEKRKASDFLFLRKAHTFHGVRRKKFKEIKADDSGMKIGIGEKDIEELYRKLDRNQVVVVVSGTGSGKSTFVPARLLVPSPNYSGDFVERLLRQGQIVITQPRIAATQRIPRAIGEKYVGSKVGSDQLIGYRHGDPRGGKRGEQWSRWNQAVVVTDGSLKNWIMSGHIAQYSLVMVDEAHERSLNIDVVLGLLKIALIKFPHLKVVISSATIHKEGFVKTFRDEGIKAELLEISSKKKEKYLGPHYWKSGEIVEGCDCWLCSLSPKERKDFWSRKAGKVEEDDLPRVVAKFAADILENTEKGSILIFLHGQRAIEETEKLLRERFASETFVVALYADLGEKEVEKRLKKTRGSRRILIATNIAETSLTLNDVMYVIDSGFIKEVQWDSASQETRLVSRHHSQDGCRQRWGRAGRVQVGYIYALYTEEQFENFDEHTSPEVVRQRVDDSLVTAKASGVSYVTDFPWVDKPSDEELERSRKAIEESGIVDDGGDISEEGLELLRIPRPSLEAKLFMEADYFGCLFETLSLILIVSDRDGTLRVGQNLFDPNFGLLTWDPDWPVWKKFKAEMVYKMLRFGCQDDVSFLLKMVQCFWEAQRIGKEEEWAKSYFVNYYLSDVVSQRDDLLEGVFGESVTDRERCLKFNRLGLVRYLIRKIFPNFPIKVISEGDETEEKTGFMFLDQKIPFGSLVLVVEKEDESYVTGLVKGDRLEKPVRAKWLGSAKNSEAYVFCCNFSHKEEPEILVAPFSEEEIRSYLDNKRGETIKVSIETVIDDKVVPKRFVVGVIEEGRVLPLEGKWLTLVSSGHGLERLEGRTLELLVEDNTQKDGWPIVSNLRAITADLLEIRKKKEWRTDGFVILSGDENMDWTIVEVEGGSGATLIFEVHRDFVPGKSIKYLEDGEPAVVKIVSKEGKFEWAWDEKVDKDKLPENWECDEKKGMLSMPRCADRSEVDSVIDDPVQADKLWRESWRSAFDVSVELLKERLPKVRVGEFVSGEITRISYDEEGNPDQLSVILNDGTPGYVYTREVSESGKIGEGEKLELCVRKVEKEKGFLRLVGAKEELSGRIRKWNRAIVKKRNWIAKLEENVRSNEHRLSGARTSSFAVKVSGWIEEDRIKISRLFGEIEEKEKEIESAEKEIERLKF